ncbi:MAG: hypothetical protein GC178_17850 [Flavobacteriales bacterium]|nr:hypothetical protein [Flavobacteriales bacterium]
MRTSVFIVPFLLVAIIGCKKDPIEPGAPEVKDKWELTSTSTMHIDHSNSYQIQFDGQDRLFAIQRYPGSSFTYCHCETDQGIWTRFAIDSMNTIVNRTLLTKVSRDGNLWVLTDTRLIRVSSCGAFDSYTVASSDSLSLSIEDFYNRFVGIEIVDGTPWLLHATWGLYHYDFETEALVHHPILHPYPFYNDLSEIGYFESLGAGNDGYVLFSNNDGRAWVRHSSENIAALLSPGCYGCRYNSFRSDRQGDLVATITNDGGNSHVQRVPEYTDVPTLALSEAPHYYSGSVFDYDGFLAYYSGGPDYQPYIGLQPNGGDELTVNARDAIEEGNVIVHDLAFNSNNELFAATDKGVIKYLGRDE